MEEIKPLTMAYQGSESQEIGRSSAYKVWDESRENILKDLNLYKEVWLSFKPCLPEKYTYGEVLPPLRSSEVKIAPAQCWLSLRDDFLHSENGNYSLHSENGTGTIGGVRLPNQGPFKCIMVGDGGTGKTTYVKRHLTGEFEKKYEPTMGMLEHMLKVPTKQGSTQFLCVDTPGHEKPGTLRDSYYEGADCGIIFCDITAKQTQMDVPMWYDDLYRVCGDIPIVVCGNKMDLKKRQVKTKKVTFHMKKKLQYYEISAKSGYNLDKPFQYLAEKLAGYVEGANCI